MFDSFIHRAVGALAHPFKGTAILPPLVSGAVRMSISASFRLMRSSIRLIPSRSSSSSSSTSFMILSIVAFLAADLVLGVSNEAGIFMVKQGNSTERISKSEISAATVNLRNDDSEETNLQSSRSTNEVPKAENRQQSVSLVAKSEL